jgi:cell division protein FtsB
VAEPGLPTTWREAVPYVIWIVLVLGFGLEFTTNLIHTNWLLALISFCAMAGLAAVTLHWPQLRSWAETVSPNWVVACFALLLIVVTLASFQQGSSLDVAVATAQKSTLIEWLQQAQREQNQAIHERDQLRTRMQTLESQQSSVARPNPIIEATAHLSSADKEQLAKTLYDIAQLLDRTVELSESAGKEVSQIGNEAFGAPPKPISKDLIETHQQRLLSLLESAKAYHKEVNSVISSGNGKYYGSQISYVVGDRPGEKMLALRDTIDRYIHYFDAWSKIKNVEEPEQRGLLGYQQYPFSVAMSEIRMWGEECDRRLQEIRNAMQRS